MHVVALLFYGIAFFLAAIGYVAVHQPELTLAVFLSAPLIVSGTMIVLIATNEILCRLCGVD